jgi:hypothetical protein
MQIQNVKVFEKPPHAPSRPQEQLAPPAAIFETNPSVNKDLTKGIEFKSNAAKRLFGTRAHSQQNRNYIGDTVKPTYTSKNPNMLIQSM